MYFIPVKPVSINKQYCHNKQGRRFKTEVAKSFQKNVKLLLPGNIIIPDYIRMRIVYHFRSHGSDVSNPTKLLVDTLSEFYGFNDNRIYKNVEIKQVVGDDGIEGFSFSIDDFFKPDSEFKNLMNQVDIILGQSYIAAWKFDENQENKYELKRRLDICRKAINYFNDEVNREKVDDNE